MAYFEVQHPRDTRSEIMNYPMALIQVRMSISHLVARRANAKSFSERREILFGLRDCIRDFESWLFPYLRIDKTYTSKRLELIELLKALSPLIQNLRLNDVPFEDDERTADALFYDALMDWADLVILKFSYFGILFPFKHAMNAITGDVEGKKFDWGDLFADQKHAVVGEGQPVPGSNVE